MIYRQRRRKYTGEKIIIALVLIFMLLFVWLIFALYSQPTRVNNIINIDDGCCCQHYRWKLGDWDEK